MLDKTYRPDSIEEDIYRRQDKAGVFRSGSSSGQPFCMMMPPPNVTGSLHMGHALNSSLQDILARYYRMQGRDVLWQPGMDHAGIATQMVVERQLAEKGIKRATLGREKFLEAVWQWRQESGGSILAQLRRLGAGADWPRERFTLDEGLSRAVCEMFVRLYRDGLIYRDRRLVNWDPVLGTAISDLEVVNRNLPSQMWHIRYPLVSDSDDVLIVATTRPETLPGDVAVAVHPDDERYQHLIGRHCRLPIFDRELPIIADSYADPEKGSGAVKITPAHDFNDFAVSRRHDLPMIDIFDDHGRTNDALPPEWRGLDRLEARKRVVAQLENQGLIEREENVTIPIPHGDRSMAVIEPRLTRQWFVDAPKLAKKAIEAVEKGRIRFIPQHWEKTYFEWMRHIEPWCISRQIWWGHRIPVWYGPDGHAFAAHAADEAMDQARKHYGKNVPLNQEEDVLDTWFSSALWPFSTLGWPDQTPALQRYYPTDVLVTGFDIIFFWIARMAMMGIYAMDDVPFRTVYIHALVRDAQGQKMSKSRGNVVDPLQLVETYGADALRFTLAALAAPGRDVRLDEERLRGYRNFATKIWNAARFCTMNNVRRDPAFRPDACRIDLNIWLIGQLADGAKDIGPALEQGRFDEGAAKIHRLIRSVFCDWYLELAKLRLSGESPCAETQATCAFALDTLLTLLSPFMPAISATLREAMDFGAVEDVLVWPNISTPRSNIGRLRMDRLIDYISSLRTARADAGVPAGKALSLIGVLDSSSHSLVKEWEGEMCRLARLDRITLRPSLSKTGSKKESKAGGQSMRLPVAGGEFELLMDGIVDLDLARSRLKKEIDAKNVEVQRCEAKLSNLGFLKKAPKDVISEHKQRLQRAKDDGEALHTSLQRLG